MSQLSITRCIAAVLATALVALAACDRSSAPDEAQASIAPPRRILLITIDTLRADFLPLDERGAAIAPFLSSLARRGFVFDNAYSASSHTGPAHASLFTGSYPYQHRLLRNGDALRDSLPTLAEGLAQAGYATAGFISVNFLNGLRRGFARFDAAEFSSDQPPYHRAGATTVDRAIDWLEARATDERFFLWLHLYDVHEWASAEAEYARFAALLEESSADELGLRERLRSSEVSHRAFEEIGLSPAEGVAAYRARIRYVDHQIERLSGALEANGLSRDTLWIVTSDHGEGLGDHGYLRHGKYLYQEQLQVPLLIVAPARGRSARRVKRWVRLVDLMPTLLDLVGPPPRTQPGDFSGTGRSFRVLLDGQGPAYTVEYSLAQRRPLDAGRTAAGWKAGELVSIQDGQRKQIFSSSSPPQSYALDDDPHERNDLAGSADRSFARLTAAYRQIAREIEVSEQELGVPQIDSSYHELLRALGYME